MQDDTQSVIDQILKEDNFISKAKLLRFLIVGKGQRIKDLAKALSMKESYVCHIMRLNRLNDFIVDGYYSNLISISHLFIISRLKSKELMEKAYEEVLTHSYSVSQTEELIRDMLYHTKTVGAHIDPHELRELTKQIQESLGVEVKIVQTRIKTKCIVEIKGSLAETTPKLREVLKILRSHHGSQPVKVHTASEVGGKRIFDGPDFV